MKEVIELLIYNNCTTNLNHFRFVARIKGIQYITKWIIDPTINKQIIIRNKDSTYTIESFIKNL